METLASTGIDFQGTEIPYVTSSPPFFQEFVGVDPSAFGFFAGSTADSSKPSSRTSSSTTATTTGAHRRIALCSCIHPCIHPNMNYSSNFVTTMCSFDEVEVPLREWAQAEAEYRQARGARAAPVKS